jgi:hypothetical protein
VADPDCLIVAGSVSNIWEPSFRWTEHCFRRGVLKSGIVGWSVHPYGLKRPEDYVPAYARMRKLMAKHGAPKGMLLLNTERGFPLRKAEGWTGGDPRKSRTYQAWHFVRQYLVDVLTDTRLTIWYEWTGRSFGLIHGRAERPAVRACTAMSDQLDGYRFARRLPADSQRDFLLLFENPSGRRKLAAWTSPPRGRSPDHTKDHPVDVKLPGRAPAATRALDAFDVFGEKRRVEVTSGKITLTLTGAPQYVSLPAAKGRKRAAGKAARKAGRPGKGRRKAARSQRGAKP